MGSDMDAPPTGAAGHDKLDVIEISETTVGMRCYVSVKAESINPRGSAISCVTRLYFRTAACRPPNCGA